MRIYICARNMYHDETEKIARFLGKHGHMVYYAAKDTYQNAPADEVFLNNLVLIRNCDVFIAYFTKDGHYGIDFAVEVGIAAEAGKPIIGYMDIEKGYLEAFEKRFEKDIMFSGAFTRMFDDLEEFGNYLLLI
ncbi:MAG: nucleoside 2-deoxyribosyltransferase [Candidatus Bathyarchaeota archaeon]|nr:nucleoside 2-deoxyribosyltransferase [Candidatus Bathyarchaeota archaeon]